ncbi:hypothetical protein A3C20_04620 [Candidatus Kaiserbacteria bacterium RIFCSPHIGHO2_02_FULL_55_25]|uniref:Uncharacterized protein n=1 Tax=Candidatus Kaiserbacteria bacterium RIFCSPHIGHO2_02_FULL_55_25 TaxID=1798498 RepID=A0A1F6EAS3_9BACT|nr:MAG: hypothetical protein A3C20_04620 [Candidatus Kaiserbacteria bacterium RIFCSPHIGHO2_02_FULL_55_25]OGG78134.1 MAG: hypothetical protein A3F56_03580 [Candidatus Kaiserbacteria bacterium RIFCSPHIGHO2_12_FULL_55_13]OGG83432.1 MAG: hypothetical protein A3A42_04445 [Candidatus Kaiserbacteria bacterium RIFCSPLOWO2_01_FULL_55_25]
MLHLVMPTSDGVAYQRKNGFFLEKIAVVAELARRYDADTDHEVFRRAYAERHTAAEASNPESDNQIHADVQQYLEGGPLPDYVYDTYTAILTRPLAK